MIALRSLLFNLVMFVSVLIYAPLMLPTALLPYPLRYRLISQWARFQVFLLKTLCRLDYRVEGLEHLPPGAAILLSKHQSAWETIAFQQIFPAQTWVLKRELMWIPLFGWALALTRPIAIDRGAGRKAVEAVVTQGRERLQSGIWVVVFPEGTRVAPGTRKRYAMGGAILAAETGYPVVPVAHNAGSFWLRRGFLKKPGTVRVVIGPTINPRGRKAEEIIKQVEEWIEGRMVELERS
ncbi:1-acyl-sn-glycerol-3-phosphate acyltransferase [Sulfuricaulis limicola]|uniref:1-acyl-sn-glycerol-3-phosphate acyltransferase n=2 Tax=Sulfuricaulis limicola TaxID=1620215 RepID=A0A1B4XJ36_9GAMM|nr:lysophospholipid acyltransferase family protein [Sulfuricaulis limicola]BAV34815.1 1-acyl-sn-glycerol-3-phosphate acyltransferase [Sulfuricaulis limicola]